MSEIKSTLDLVLEKTRHLRLDDEERREVLREDARNRARGYAYKYIEGVWKLAQLLKTLGEEDQDPDVFEETARIVVDRIKPGEADDRLLDDLAEWIGEGAQETIRGIRQELDDFDRRKSSLEREIRDLVLDDLKRKGIYGTAVVPKIRRHPAWIDRKDQLVFDSNRVLEPHKGELLRLLTDRN